MEPPHTVLDQLVRSSLASLPALGVHAARPLGITLVLPVFTRTELGALLRASVAVGLALPLMGHPRTTSFPARSHDSPGAARAQGLFVGLLIGFLLGVPFWSIQAVGELIDTQRGSRARSRRSIPQPARKPPPWGSSSALPPSRCSSRQAVSR